MSELIRRHRGFVIRAINLEEAVETFDLAKASDSDAADEVITDFDDPPLQPISYQPSLISLWKDEDNLIASNEKSLYLDLHLGVDNHHRYDGDKE